MQECLSYYYCLYARMRKPGIKVLKCLYQHCLTSKRLGGCTLGGLHQGRLHAPQTTPVQATEPLLFLPLPLPAATCIGVPWPHLQLSGLGLPRCTTSCSHPELWSVPALWAGLPCPTLLLGAERGSRGGGG